MTSNLTTVFVLVKIHYLGSPYESKKMIMIVSEGKRVRYLNQGIRANESLKMNGAKPFSEWRLSRNACSSMGNAKRFFNHT